MLISVANASLQNLILFVLLAGVLFIPSRKDAGKNEILSLSLSHELKGAAILTIIFGHIGYFLSSNHQFLAPLSNISGAGVDLFLLLSGYGLTASMLSHPRSTRDFFIRHFSKLYIPLWLSLMLLFSASALILHHTYGILYVVRSFLGIFPSADLFSDINSPLWYFTYIVVLYIFFRFTWREKWSVLSAGLVAVLTFLFTISISPFVSPGNANLYLQHMLAFPLGMVLAISFLRFPAIVQGVVKLRENKYAQIIILPSLVLFIFYVSLHNTVPGFELIANLSIALAFLVFFIIKKRGEYLLGLLGVYSFEIYLLHWPILYDYDVLYKIFPASLATILYLALFILLGMLFHNLTMRVTEKLDSGKKSEQI